MRFLFPLCLAACVAETFPVDAPARVASASQSIAIAAPQVLDVPEMPTIVGTPDAKDPLLVAIREAADVLSPGGTRITDYEWSGVWYGSDTSTLPEATWLAVMNLVIATDGDLAGQTMTSLLQAAAKHVSPPPAESASAPKTVKQWSSASKGAWTQRLIVPFQAPNDVYAAMLQELSTQRFGLAIVRFAAWAVIDGNGATVAYRVGYVSNDCGWCEAGALVTMSVAGVELSREEPSGYSASGYCC